MFSRPALLCVFLGAVALMACTPRGSFTLSPQTDPDASVIPVFVATNRPLSDGNAVAVGRSDQLSFQQYDISIPANRDKGRIQWPKSTPDPARDFLTLDAGTYRDSAAFIAAVRRELASKPPSERDVVVFVPGYNTTLAEGVYRLAQMDHDLSLEAVPIYFAWPTAEQMLGYVHDRDSALYSRFDLLRFLQLIHQAGANQVIVMAHSMGGLLTLEVMRQAELNQPGSVPDLIDGLVMISPDIDADLALQELTEISALPVPFIVFTNDDDRALRLASRLGGDNPRLGRGAEVADFSEVPVVFLDVTAFSDDASGDFGHLTLGSSPALIDLVPQMREVARALDYNPAAAPGLVPGTVLSVRQASEVVLTPGSP